MRYWLAGMVLVAGLGWLSQHDLPRRAPAPTPAPESLESYVRRVGGRAACASFLNGKRVGYLVYETRVEGDSAVEVCESYLRPSDQPGAFRREVYRKRYSLATGELTAYSRRLVQDKSVTWIDVTRGPGGYQVVVDASGRVTRRTVPSVRANLRDLQQFDAWLGAAREPGAKRVRWDADWLQNPVDREVFVTYEGRGRVGEVPTSRSTWRDNSASMVLELDDLTHVMRAEMAGGFEERACTEEQAREGWPVAVVPLQGGLGDRLQMVGPRVDVPQDSRQSVTADGVIVLGSGPAGPPPTAAELEGLGPRVGGSTPLRIGSLAGDREALVHLRQWGIPARPVDGLRYSSANRDFRWARWVEAWDGDRWVDVDPDDVFTAERYIKLDSPDGFGVCGLLELRNVSPRAPRLK